MLNLHMKMGQVPAESYTKHISILKLEAMIQKGCWWKAWKCSAV